MNALLSQLKLPEIATPLDITRLISDIPKYKDWAGTKPPEDKVALAPNGAARITYPKTIERYFQASPSKVELLQQPKTILVQQGTSSIPVMNPDAFLVRYSVGTTWASVFPSVADIHDQIKSFQTAKFKVLGNTELLCGDKADSTKLVDCVMQTGTSNRFVRLAGGFKTQFNYGQSPQIQQNINVGGTPAANENYSLSGEIDFDPKTLFLNGTDWNNAYNSALAYNDSTLADNALTEFHHRVAVRCKLNKDANVLTTECIRRVSGLTPKQMAAAVLIPQISASIKNQFDFIKQGGLLVAAPFPTNSLYDITLTVDPSRLFPSAKQRQDALNALAELQKTLDEQKKLHEPDASKGDAAKGSQTDPKAEVLKLYASFASEPEELDKGSWYEEFRNALSQALVAQD